MVPNWQYDQLSRQLYRLRLCHSNCYTGCHRSHYKSGPSVEISSESFSISSPTGFRFVDSSSSLTYNTSVLYLRPYHTCSRRSTTSPIICIEMERPFLKGSPEGMSRRNRVKWQQIRTEVHINLNYLIVRIGLCSNYLPSMFQLLTDYSFPCVISGLVPESSCQVA